MKSRRYVRAYDWDLLEVFYPVAQNHHMAPGRARKEYSHLRYLSGGIKEERLRLMSRRNARSAVWWRRRELNPGPKTFSTTDLHV